MKFTTITAALLLPLLAVATTTAGDASPTTTLTKTTHVTLTKTLYRVVASVTSTYGHNTTTAAGPTAVGTGSTTTLSSPSGTGAAPSQTSAIGAASSLNSLYAGSAGIVVMVAAAFL